MDPVTQRIGAIGIVLSVLASIICLAWIAVVHDGEIIQQVVQTFELVITSVVASAAPSLALYHTVRGKRLAPGQVTTSSTNSTTTTPTT